MRSAVYAKIESAVSPNNGRIDFDRAGRLAGNWFLEGLAPADSGSVTAGPKQKAFVRDVLNPSAGRISIGGTLALSGVFAMATAAPDPAEVSVASGAVGYRLAMAQGASQVAGLLMVQLLDDTHLRAEVFAGSQAAFEGSQRQRGPIFDRDIGTCHPAAAPKCPNVPMDRSFIALTKKNGGASRRTRRRV